MVIGKVSTLWVTAFDGGKALVFRATGLAEDLGLELVAQFDNANPPDRDQTSDAPGRLPDGAGGGGGAGLPAGVAHGASALDQTDRHDLEERRFVDRLIAHLNREAEAGAFGSLVLLAPADALGEARKQIGSALADKIVHDEAKDVVNEPTAAIAARVQTLVNA